MEAKPGDKDFRAMNVFIDYHADTRCCMHVGRCANWLQPVLEGCMEVGCTMPGHACFPSRDHFYPRPHVDSVVAEFLLLSPSGDLGRERERVQFFHFVDQSFTMKRKTLVNNLKPVYAQEQLQRCMAVCKIPMMNRAETLDLGDFIRLFKCLRDGGSVFTCSTAED